MKISISPKGRKHIGRKALISIQDRDLAKINWSCIRVSKREDAHLYVVHVTSKTTAPIFGVPLHKMVYLHKVILARKLGMKYAEILGTRLIADHKNGNGLDNRRRNIRKATHTQNVWNRRYDPFTCIVPSGSKFEVTLHRKRVRYYLGTFDTHQEALEARDNLRKKLDGPFCRK